MPPFYIGSTKIENIKKGYHGSVSSAKWSTIWKEELKNNPHLFKTFIIPDTVVQTVEDAVALEEKWHKIFDVVKDSDFVNLAYARGGFHSTIDSMEKAEETKRKNGTNPRTVETRKKIGDANRGRKLPPRSEATRQKLSDAGKNRILTQEHKTKISLANTGKTHSDETRKKLSLVNAGRKLSAEHKAKINRKGQHHTEETKRKIGQSNKGKLIGYKRPPMSEETKEKIRQANIGKKWSDDLRMKIKETKDNNRKMRLTETEKAE